MYKIKDNIVLRTVDGMVYCPEIEKWVTIEEYQDNQAKELQQKIAKKYNLLDELSEFIQNLAKKNGITNY